MDVCPPAAFFHASDQKPGDDIGERAASGFIPRPDFRGLKVLSVIVSCLLSGSVEAV